MVATLVATNEGAVKVTVGAAPVEVTTLKLIGAESNVVVPSVAVALAKRVWVPTAWSNV